MRYVLLNNKTRKAVAGLKGYDFFMGGRVEKSLMSDQQTRCYNAIVDIINAGGAVLPPHIIYTIPLELIEDWFSSRELNQLGELVGYTYLAVEGEEDLVLHTLWKK